MESVNKITFDIFPLINLMKMSSIMHSMMHFTKPFCFFLVYEWFYFLKRVLHSPKLTLT